MSGDEREESDENGKEEHFDDSRRELPDGKTFEPIFSSPCGRPEGIVVRRGSGTAGSSMRDLPESQTPGLLDTGNVDGDKPSVPFYTSNTFMKDRRNERGSRAVIS